MALPDNALTTLDTALDELGLTSDSGSQDARLERYISVASDLFEAATSRKWYWATGHVERVPAFNTQYLQLTDHVPVDSVTSIVWDDGDETDTIDADDYTLTNEEKDSGLIRRIDSLWSTTERHFTEIATERLAGSDTPLYKVTYDGGYVTPQQAADDGSLTRSLPYDVEDAVLTYVVMRWRQKGRDQTIKKESVLRESITYVDGQMVPASFKSAVQRHKRAVVL